MLGASGSGLVMSSRYRRWYTPGQHPRTGLLSAPQQSGEEPLCGRDVRMARAALRLRHAGQGLLDVLAAAGPGGLPAGAAGDGAADRKSTRLNSSHVSISYA